MIDPILREELRRDEGVKLRPYVDTTGHVTIGCGRNLTDVGISLEEAELLLENDMRRVDAALVEAMPWVETLDPVRKRVVQNMCFNLGLSGLMGFRVMLHHLRAGDYDGAANAMADSKWTEQVGRRAQRLIVMMRTGQV
ncbi:MAG: glycoside hydrolase family protein [Gemmatimonadaceae bacterium]|nr:glycoside hydrolase family protein [Gemmatimonadaceae bacterium]